MSGISGLLITRNAEASLAWALGSLAPWVDEIVVVDMHSDDSTHKIAAAFGARVVLTEPVGYADPARAFGITQVRGPWVMMLDADEVVPEPLSRHLREIAAEDRADAVVLPFRTHIMGVPRENGPWSLRKDRHVRFFKTWALAHDPRPHVPAELVPQARVDVLDPSRGLFVEHFAHRDLGDLVERANRYTTIQARQDVAAGTVLSTRRAVRSAVERFTQSWVGDRGYRDGWLGFHESVFVAYYELLRQGKGRQFLLTGDAEAVHHDYERQALALVAAYAEGQLSHETR